MAMPTDLVAGAQSAELEISGMTCAACAARIERKLNRTDGVSAAVNYATERAQTILDNYHPEHICATTDTLLRERIDIRVPVDAVSSTHQSKYGFHASI